MKFVVLGMLDKACINNKFVEKVNVGFQLLLDELISISFFEFMDFVYTIVFEAHVTVYMLNVGTGLIQYT